METVLGLSSPTNEEADTQPNEQANIQREGSIASSIASLWYNYDLAFEPKKADKSLQQDKDLAGKTSSTSTNRTRAMRSFISKHRLNMKALFEVLSADILSPPIKDHT